MNNILSALEKIDVASLTYQEWINIGMALQAEGYDSSERYGSEWRKIRNRYIKAHPLCEECLKAERLTPSKEVHHVVPINHGGTHDENNLMALCKSCHSRITAESGDRWKR